MLHFSESSLNQLYGTIKQIEITCNKIPLYRSTKFGIPLIQSLTCYKLKKKFFFVIIALTRWKVDYRYWFLVRETKG